MSAAGKKQLAPNLQVAEEKPRIGDDMGAQHGPEAPAGRCDATPADLDGGLNSPRWCSVINDSYSRAPPGSGAGVYFLNSYIENHVQGNIRVVRQ